MRQMLLAIAREVARLPRAVFGYNRVVLSKMDYDEYWQSHGEIEG
jgi:hypothetical protein